MIVAKSFTIKRKLYEFDKVLRTLMTKLFD